MYGVCVSVCARFVTYFLVYTVENSKYSFCLRKFIFKRWDCEFNSKFKSLIHHFHNITVLKKHTRNSIHPNVGYYTIRQFICPIHTIWPKLNVRQNHEITSRMCGYPVDIFIRLTNNLRCCYVCSYKFINWEMGEFVLFLFWKCALLMWNAHRRAKSCLNSRQCVIVRAI